MHPRHPRRRDGHEGQRLVSWSPRRRLREQDLPRGADLDEWLRVQRRRGGRCPQEGRQGQGREEGRQEGRQEGGREAGGDAGQVGGRCAK